MITVNLNANTTCMHNFALFVNVNCIVLSKHTEELFLIIIAHRSKQSLNMSSHCMTTEGRDFIRRDGVISDHAFMEMWDTTLSTRLITARGAVSKHLRVMPW